ncbi:MAG: hypothetical protein IPM00_00625 [Tetrasphaera sp.]|nr:hypothetical protein [Tetrasphaera sp.]
MLSGPLVEVAAGAQGLPGVALLRDQHRALGLAALAQAVLVGHLLGRMRASGSGGAGVSVSAATAALALTVSAAPDLPGHLTRAYRPVTFPSAWASVVAPISSSSDVPTTMVSPCHGSHCGGPAGRGIDLPRPLAEDCLPRW